MKKQLKCTICGHSDIGTYREYDNGDILCETCVLDFYKSKLSIANKIIENLKCCGNCKKSQQNPKDIRCTILANLCDRWESDELTARERK